MFEIKTDETDLDLLNRSPKYSELDASLLNDKCDYTEVESCLNLNPNNYNLLTLQLNVRSLLAHQHELNKLLCALEKRNSKIDIVLLCETFLAKNAINMVRIPVYTHVGNYRKERKGGGVSILIREGISYTRRPDLDIFDEGKTESVFIELLSKNGKKIVIGSLYIPPNTDIPQFSANIANIISKNKSCKGKIVLEIIIGMDYNVDLLKCGDHRSTQTFIDDLNSLNLLPTITRPTRITSYSATLIDNIYVSEQLHRDFDSTIMLHDISDHLPVLTMLKQTKMINKELLKFKSRCLNESNVRDINHRLMQKDWIGLLTGTTSNDKFDTFTSIVSETIEVGPLKTVRISAKRRYVEP